MTKNDTKMVNRVARRKINALVYVLTYYARLKDIHPWDIENAHGVFNVLDDKSDGFSLLGLYRVSKELGIPIVRLLKEAEGFR